MTATNLDLVAVVVIAPLVTGEFSAAVSGVIDELVGETMNAVVGGTAGVVMDDIVGEPFGNAINEAVTVTSTVMTTVTVCELAADPLKCRVVEIGYVDEIGYAGQLGSGALANIDNQPCKYLSHEYANLQLISPIPCGPVGV
jgi:hypothetical protein